MDVQSSSNQTQSDPIRKTMRSGKSTVGKHDVHIGPIGVPSRLVLPKSLSRLNCQPSPTHPLALIPCPSPPADYELLTVCLRTSYTAKKLLFPPWHGSV